MWFFVQLIDENMPKYLSNKNFTGIACFLKHMRIYTAVSIIVGPTPGVPLYWKLLYKIITLKKFIQYFFNLFEVWGYFLGGIYTYDAQLHSNAIQRPVAMVTSDISVSVVTKYGSKAAYIIQNVKPFGFWFRCWKDFFRCHHLKFQVNCSCFLENIDVHITMSSHDWSLHTVQSSNCCTRKLKPAQKEECMAVHCKYNGQFRDYFH